MANVKICDRCGKKIEKLSLWPVYLEHYRSILSLEDNDYKYTYDLCGTCTKKLAEFLNERITEATDAVVKE